MDFLIKNVSILSMAEGVDEPFVSSLLVKDGIITKIGKDLSDSADRVIDGTNKVLIPGFVNAHTHLAMTLMRNYMSDKPNLQEWLKEIWRAEDQIKSGELYYPALLGLSEMILSGTTTFSDMYFFPEDTIRAVNETGIRAEIGLTLFGDEEETKKRLCDLYPRLKALATQNPRLTISLAPHAIYTTTSDTLRLAREFAESEKINLHIHVSETYKEVEESLKEHGATPLQYIKNISAIPKMGYLAHCIWLNDDEIGICKESKLSIIHCPSSNAKLSSGHADIRKYASLGINLAFGTDGASSNNNLDLFKEIRTGALLSNLLSEGEDRIRPIDFLRMATLGGAVALHKDDRIGTIEVGKDADLVLLDLDMPHTAPVNEIPSALVFSADARNVKMVMCEGNILMEDGELKTIDKDEAIGKTREIWRKILGRINA